MADSSIIDPMKLATPQGVAAQTKAPVLSIPKVGGGLMTATQAAPVPAQPAMKPTSVNDALGEFTSRDSPLMQKAQTEGMKLANRRGLLNSSIAAGQATDAALNYAVPLAQQQAAIRSTESLAGQDRALQERLQQKDINYQTSERALDRNLQQTLAQWNLDSSDRNAAAQFLYNMETLYNSTVNNIQANTNLSAKDRETQLTSAKNLRDRQLDFVQQMYDVALDWGQARPTTPTTGTGGTGTGTGTKVTNTFGQQVTLPPGVTRETFNAAAYLSKYPDVKNYPAGAWQHYIDYGIKEGRTPG
jgi:hypothetical protein